MRVSVSSLTRRTVGRMPRCVASRKAAVAAAKVGKVHEPYDVTAGTGRIRTVTSVSTPKAPSEPRNSSRRSGPAALEGARPSCSSPAGVATRRACTRSSNRPYPREAWPLDRVAAYPPSEAYWKLCGKCPRV